MTTTSPELPPAGEAQLPRAMTPNGIAQAFLRAPRVQLWSFTLTLLGSALLLFSVQPMFAKMALPRLGGSPSVWAVSMCFFQAALLAGYCYAHALDRHLTPRRALPVHLAMLVVTALALPIGLPAALGEPPQGDAYFWLIGVLALGVGLPFFAVSATAPLLQSWFGRTGHAQAGDPYFLYGASNLGSLVALLAYPLLIEPALGLSRQSAMWSVGFVMLVAAIAICGLVAVVAGARPRTEAGEILELPGDTPDTAKKATWVALACIPSGLMVAATTYVTTDIASAPFIWVVPLALFLATFILVFRDRAVIDHDLVSVALPVAVMAQLVVPWLGAKMILAVVTFFLVALVCHRELYLARPGPRYLTEFYIWMSLGGVLGGVFAAIVAPQIFSSVFEFTLFMVAALFCRPRVLLRASAPLDYRRIAGLACLAIAAILTAKIATEAGGGKIGTLAMFAVAVAVALAVLKTREWAENKVVFLLALATVTISYPAQFNPIHAERSFFGTVRVVDTEDGKHRLMLHGTTLHGARRLQDEAGNLVRRALPATYYQAETPMARGVAVTRKLRETMGSGPAAGIRVGVVGLGTGSLACYAEKGDAWRFYEIDPVVVRIAKDERYFDFLSRCAPEAPIVVGDARLTLAKEPAEAFDYLVIDAFSSDSVPVHLLTVEAMTLYLEKISPTGIVALHVSNRHLDLIPAVASTAAQAAGGASVLVKFVPKDESTDAASSNVVFLARDGRALEQVRRWPDAEPLRRTGARAWTDDYSDVLSAVFRKIRD